MNRKTAVRANIQPEPHPEEDLLHRAVEGARVFLAGNWLHIVLALAVVMAVAAGLNAYRYRRQTHIMKAWGEIGSLPATELRFMVHPTQAAQLRQEALVQIEDIIRNSPKTPATVWALLQLGGLQADSGNWAAAANAYSKLLADYPESEAGEAARPALATSLESLGKYREAAKIYENLIKNGDSHYLLSAGRCRELAGELGTARQLYERLAGDSTQEGALIRLAESRLSDLALGNRLPPPPPLASELQAAISLPSVVPPIPSDTTLGPVPMPLPEVPGQEND